jgi:hypothetical protein
MKRVRLSYVLAALAVAGIAMAADERGTAEGTVGSGKVTIEYGKVALKGRTVESLIEKLPEDRIWRAGINEVTTLTATAPFSVGGKKVPAGKYSVYVFAPKTGDWSLVLNSDPGIELGVLAKKLGFQVGEAESKHLWPHVEGYAGIADKEVARVTMKEGSSKAAVDPFSISVKPASSNLDVTLAWGEKSWTAELQPSK